MLVGHPPYPVKREKDNLLEFVKKGKYSFPTSTWCKVSAQAKDLVKKLMNLDVEKRFNGEQTLKHPWMQNNFKRSNSAKKRKRECVEKSRPRAHVVTNLDDEKNGIQYQMPARKKMKNAKGEAQPAMHHLMMKRMEFNIRCRQGKK